MQVRRVEIYEADEMNLTCEGFTENQVTQLRTFLERKGVPTKIQRQRRRNPQALTIINGAQHLAVHVAPYVLLFASDLYKELRQELSKKIIKFAGEWFRRRNWTTRHSLVLYGADGEVVRRFKQAKKKK